MVKGKVIIEEGLSVLSQEPCFAIINVIKLVHINSLLVSCL